MHACKSHHSPGHSNSSRKAAQLYLAMYHIFPNNASRSPAQQCLLHPTLTYRQVPLPLLPTGGPACHPQPPALSPFPCIHGRWVNQARKAARCDALSYSQGRHQAPSEVCSNALFTPSRHINLCMQKPPAAIDGSEPSSNPVHIPHHVPYISVARAPSLFSATRKTALALSSLL